MNEKIEDAFRTAKTSCTIFNLNSIINNIIENKKKESSRENELEEEATILTTRHNPNWESFRAKRDEIERTVGDEMNKLKISLFEQYKNRFDQLKQLIENKKKLEVLQSPKSIPYNESIAELIIIAKKMGDDEIDPATKTGIQKLRKSLEIAAKLHKSKPNLSKNRWNSLSNNSRTQFDNNLKLVFTNTNDVMSTYNKSKLVELENLMNSKNFEPNRIDELVNEIIKKNISM